MQLMLRERGRQTDRHKHRQRQTDRQTDRQTGLYLHMSWEVMLRG